MSDGGRAGLLMIDVQNDFFEGGALPVPHADRVVPVLNEYIAAAVARGMTIYASRDWHPAVTHHFSAYGGAWPAHCVQGTHGAGFHADLLLPSTTVVVSKGETPDSQGYSDFEGRTDDGTLFPADLRTRGITHLYVGGIATEYCVKHSVLDALRAGLKVTVLQDAIAGLESQIGDSARAIAGMRERGADVTSADL